MHKKALTHSCATVEISTMPVDESTDRFLSAKIDRDDHQAFKSAGATLNAHIWEIIAACRRIWDVSSDRRKLAALREVREQGTSASAGGGDQLRSE
jgi:hypothetical protein